jgi:hypothetical protein
LGRGEKEKEEEKGRWAAGRKREERGREGFVFFNPFTHKTFSSFQKLF